jgi:hypothetical protein
MNAAGTGSSHLVHRHLDEVTWSRQDVTSSRQAVALMRDLVTI